MDKLHDLKDWLQRKSCSHRTLTNFEEIVNHYDGKEHLSAFWECSKCGEVLATEYSWTLPEGSRVIFPGGEHRAPST